MKTLSHGLAAVIAFGLPAFAVPALAQSQPTIAEHVTIADLDLATPKGVAEMTHRVRKAAASLCRQDGANSGPALEAQDRFDACYRKSTDEALSGR
jgi:UrcA family protein